MNFRMVSFTIGKIILLEGGLLLIPAGVSAIYEEKCFLPFLMAAAIALLIGLILRLVIKPRTETIYAKEGFLIVALSWISISAIGALPFFLSGEIPNYIDAFFETVSGFTTTGATIVDNIEGLSHGILFWRSFTHWIGGMGVLVFIIAIIPNISDRTIHVMRAEVPGPTVGKILPRIKDTAKVLYLMYIAITVTEVIFLLFGGVSLFESLIHSFGTAGTGGFSSRADSIAAFSPYVQIVITVFMLMFGVNFNIYYYVILRKFGLIRKNTELKVYLAIFLVSATIIAINLYTASPASYEGAELANRYSGNLGISVKDAAFQVSSIITTTGYSTVDFGQWPAVSKTILFLLMFVGACAGSTAGGIKVSRVILLVRSIKREIKHLIHPRAVGSIQMDGKRVDENVIHGTGVYLAVYMVVVATVFIILSFGTYNHIETNLTATVSCFNNVGPALGFAGPASSYSGFSYVSKIALSGAMLLGRLEIYPILIMFTRSAWSKK